MKLKFPKDKGRRWWMVRGGFAVLTGLLLAVFVVEHFDLWPPDEISYSEFVEAISEGAVSEISFSGEKATGERTVEGAEERFLVYIPEFAEPGLADRLAEQGVAVTSVYSGPSHWEKLFRALPILLLVAICVFVLFLMMKGKLVPGVGASGQKHGIETRPDVKFSDVAGATEAKESLQEVVGFLQDPDRFVRLGGRMPRGVLLSGEPGTGKTLLAKAVAGEAEASFFHASGSEFVEMFVGRGAARVRELFKNARENAPAIVFIDEIDAVGRSRSSRGAHSNEEREQTLNQILVELDGFDQSEGVVVLGATNRVDMLDKALLRPGRFDRKVTVGRPDLLEREAILEIHAKKVPLAQDLSLRDVARGTSGMSGAELANLVNEAALEAAKLGADCVENSHFEDARDRIVMGSPRESCVLTEQQRRLTAYHEAGHAMIPFLIPGLDPIHKVTIVPRGRAMGVTASLPERDRYGYSSRELRAQIAMLMAGRAAEELVLGGEEITTGAGNDIERATNLAEQMVTTYGMSSAVGFMKVREAGAEGSGRTVSEHTARLIDEEISRLTREGYDQAKALLIKYRGLLDDIAYLLLEMETIDRQDIETLLSLHVPEGDVVARQVGPVGAA